MRVTICELPHEPDALATAWVDLCEHTWHQESELVLLPELGMVEPVWEGQSFDPVRWAAAEAACERWLLLLRELHADRVAGTRPVTIGGRRYNQGYIWSAVDGVVPLRAKFFLPNEPGGWETTWFHCGDREFPAFHHGGLSFGLNICTELWALETYAAYAADQVQMILSPRATAAGTTAKWMSIGIVAAVRSGAYSISSNRVDRTGVYGGAGWIIGPDGQVLARTTAGMPFATIDIDLAMPAAARGTYPRNVFTEAGHSAIITG